MEQDLTNQYYLESAPISKSIIHLCIPMMIGMSVGTIYNVINAFFIGLLHNTEMMTAITLGLPIFTILMAFGNMFGVGGGTFITRLVAQKETEKANHVAGYSFYGSIIVAVLIAIIAMFIMNPITKLLGADAATVSYTRNYALAMFFGGFAVVLNFTLEQIVRSEGASKESMYGMIISTVLNFIFDPLLILILHLNVVGAAMAMALANLGAAAYYTYYLERKSEHLQGFISCFKISFKDKIEVYKIGVSQLLTTAFLIVSTLLLNNFSIAYGDSVVAGFGIALRIVQVPEFLSMGLAMGIIPLIAYNYSIKNYSRMKKGIKGAALWTIMLAVTFVTVVYIFRVNIIGMFSRDSSVLDVGAYIMVAMLISALFNGVTGLFTGVFQAAGQGIPTTIMSVTQGVLYIPVIILLHRFFGMHGVIWSMTITEIITCVMGVMLYAIFNCKLGKSQLQLEE